MQRKTETRDYKIYDYLDATVKKQSMELLTAHYAALGWECTETRDDKIYFDIKHIVLRRPHNVEHKDALQLLQIYLESAFNTIGRAEVNPCPKTLIAGLLFGIVSLAAMVLGLLGGLSVFTFIPSVWGYVILGAGAVLAVVNAAVCLKYRKIELNKTRLEVEKAAREIESVYLSAAALTNETAVSGTEEASAGGER